MKKLLILLPLILIACKPVDSDIINGYMEGEFVYIAPSASGILEEIYVTKGDNIKIGDKLFSIDTKTLQANVDTAKLSLEKAQSNYADLTKGKRSEEILIILKQKDQAEAVLKNSKQELNRSQELYNDGFASKSDLDLKTKNYNQAKGAYNEIEATLKTAMLGARDDELKMAQHDIEIAKQNLIKAQKVFDDNHPIAKTDGKVEDVFYRLGELITTGSPVIQILPPKNIKARFFINQKLLPKFELGKNILINCDGCTAPIPASITFVSSTAEFTPPVIYSVESRDKLVFMIEATPKEFTPSLHPGLPINIKLEN